MKEIVSLLPMLEEEEKSPFGLERRRVPKELRVTYVQASFLIKYQIKHSDYRKPTPFRQMELDSNSC